MSIVAPEGKWIEPKPRAVITDHDAEGRATFEKAIGISTAPAHKKVLEGIQATQGRLKFAGDGKPRIYILHDSLVERDRALIDAKKPTCTAEELPGYIWQNNDKEAPVKENDHGCDAMRYLVADRDLGGRPRVRFL
jgi:phage terminase large subunit